MHRGGLSTSLRWVLVGLPRAPVKWGTLRFGAWDLGVRRDPSRAGLGWGKVTKRLGPALGNAKGAPCIQDLRKQPGENTIEAARFPSGVRPRTPSPGSGDRPASPLSQAKHQARPGTPGPKLASDRPAPSASLRAPIGLHQPVRPPSRLEVANGKEEAWLEGLS